MSQFYNYDTLDAKINKLEVENQALKELVKEASPMMEYLHCKLLKGSIALSKYKSWNEKANRLTADDKETI